MANSKLPHERLRDWADIAERKGTFPSTLMDEELGEGFGENLKHCDSVAFRRLADEVEDAIESAYMDGTCHYFDMIAEEQGWPKRKADELVEDYVKRCFFPRPAPKVLDADGVPIEIGDTVWHVDSGEELTVDEFANRGLGLVKCSDEDLACEDFDACKLTHREPDSLRKMRDDIAAYSADMAEPGSILEDALDGWADRLTALMERGAE